MQEERRPTCACLAVGKERKHSDIDPSCMSINELGARQPMLREFRVLDFSRCRGCVLHSTSFLGMHSDFRLHTWVMNLFTSAWGWIFGKRAQLGSQSPRTVPERSLRYISVCSLIPLFPGTNSHWSKMRATPTRYITWSWNKCHNSIIFELAVSNIFTFSKYSSNATGASYINIIVCFMVMWCTPALEICQKILRETLGKFRN